MLMADALPDWRDRSSQRPITGKGLADPESPLRAVVLSVIETDHR
jgi:hypothetical protein